MRTMMFVVGLMMLGSSCDSARAQPLLEELEKRLAAEPAETVDPPAADLAPPRPGYLGLVADETAEAGRGIVVVSVRAAGPAAAAGINAGDYLITINRRAIRSLDDMAAAMRGLSVGSKVDLELIRTGRVEKFVVTLSEPPAVAAPSEDDYRRAPEVVPSRSTLGAHVNAVTDEARLRYGVPVRRGALIDSIQVGSPADRYGLPLGGVIVGVDGRPVNSPEDLAEILNAARPGQEVELSYYHGERLFRKTVRLAPATFAPGETFVPPPGSPLRLVPGSEDRPVLRKLESALDRLIKPPPAVDAADAAEAAGLRRQIDDMRSHIELLQRRIEELERLLAAERAREE